MADDLADDWFVKEVLDVDQDSDDVSKVEGKHILILVRIIPLNELGHKIERLYKCSQYLP